MYCTVLSLLVVLALAIAGPLHVEKDSQVSHQVKHVPIKAVKSYLNKTKFGARGLVNDFQDVLETSPKGADIDHHRHVAKGYLPKAIQTIVAMREAADSMLRRIDENGLEKPQVISGKQDCHQLKKSIDAIKALDIENLCSKLKRQEIIAYFKSDLNCLLGSIFELWRATERDGSYLTLGYRDIIQTIKDLLVAIETGIRRFSEEINYMDFSEECRKYLQPEKAFTPSVHVPVKPKKPVQIKPSEEGKDKKKDKAKDEGKGVHANSVIVGGVVKPGESSLVEKVEKVIKLEQKELDDIKAAAEKEFEKVGGAGKNVTVGEVGILGAKKTDEKKEEGVVVKDGDMVGSDKEKKDEKVEEKGDEATANAEKKEEKVIEKEEKKEGKVEKEEDKSVETVDKKEEKEKEVEKVEKKEEAKENEGQSEKKEVEKAKPEEEKIVTGHILPVVVENDTSAENHTFGMADEVDEKLKGVLVNEEKNLNVILSELDHVNTTSEEIKSEYDEIIKMMKELNEVIAEVNALDDIKKNKTIEREEAEPNVTVIDVITKSPVITAKLIPKVDEVASVVTQGPIPLTTGKSTLPPKAPTTPETNLKDVENEEKSLEILRNFGDDALPADSFKPKKSGDKVLKPATGEATKIEDIDDQEEKDQEEKVKEMVEIAKEEEEKKDEKVKEGEKKTEEKKAAEEKEKAVKGEEEGKKEAKKEEQKNESPVENKPVEKLVATTIKPAPVPADSKNSTLDGVISRINDEEAEVRNLIKTLNG